MKKILEFCTYCNSIGHSISNCKRKEQAIGNGKENLHKHIPIVKKFTIGKTSKTNSEPQIVNVADTNDPNHIQIPLVDVDDVVPNGNTNVIEHDNIIIPIPATSPHENKGSLESEYVDATQMVNFVPETELNERLKEQVTNFLHESWNNMADLEDLGVDLFQERNF